MNWLYQDSLDIWTEDVEGAPLDDVPEDGILLYADVPNRVLTFEKGVHHLRFDNITIHGKGVRLRVQLLTLGEVLIGEPLVGEGDGVLLAGRKKWAELVGGGSRKIENFVLFAAEVLESMRAAGSLAPFASIAPLPGARVYDGPAFANFTTGSGEKKPTYTARGLEEIARDLFTLGKGWPKVIGGSSTVGGEGGLLAVLHPSGATRMLSSADDLFAWVRESMPVAWKMGDDSTTPSPLAFVTKGELISKVFASAERIESVEMLPHVPPLPGHVYTWTAPEGYEPDGRHLDTLLAFFDNLEDETVDRPLLRAALLTPCWGGDYGTRPAFVIEADKSQSGKTTISRVVSEVWGGLLDLQLDSTRHVSPDEISKRLLTPGVRHLRILRLDNCRTEIGGQVVESLVTTDRFRGRQMYVGEGDRPNTTTLFITANAARLTVDVANRSVILRLVEHGGDPSWGERVHAYVTEHRAKIIADCVWWLTTKASAPHTVKAGWGSWVRNVLAKCAEDPDIVLHAVLDRRGDHNADQDEAQAVLECLREYTGTPYNDPSGAGVWYFVSRTDALLGLGRDLGRHFSSRSCTALLKQLIKSGAFGGAVSEHMTHSGKRGYLVRSAASGGASVQATPSGEVDYDQLLGQP